MVGVGDPPTTLHWKSALPPVSMVTDSSGYNSILGSSLPVKEQTGQMCFLPIKVRNCNELLQNGF